MQLYSSIVTIVNYTWHESEKEKEKKGDMS